MGLEPDEVGDVVFFCEPGEDFCFVLADTERQVAGHAGVEDAGLAGHELDVEGAVHGRELWQRATKVSKSKGTPREISHIRSTLRPTETVQKISPIPLP